MYEALLEVNVSEASAERAIEGLTVAGEAATKADVAELRADAAQPETRLTR